MDITELEKIKNSGNQSYKQKNYQIAFDEYTSAVNQIENLFVEQLSKKQDPVQILYLSLLTNRALCGTQLKNYDQVIADCETCLFYDETNVKAIYRKSLAIMEQGKALNPDSPEETKDLNLLRKQNGVYELARKDLERVFLHDAANEAAKEKLNEIIKLQVKIRLVLKKYEPKQENKKEEVKEEKIPERNVKKQKPNLNEEYLKNVTQNVVLQVMDDLINGQDLPQTCSAFERNVQAFKKDLSKLFDYILRIPSSKKDMPTETIFSIVSSIEQTGISKNSAYSLEILTAISQTNKFDLQLMCMTKGEKKKIENILREIEIKVGTQLQKEIQYCKKNFKFNQ